MLLSNSRQGSSNSRLLVLLRYISVSILGLSSVCKVLQQARETCPPMQATGQWDEDERHGPVVPHSRLQDPPEW